MHRLVGLLGIAVLLGACWAASTDRKAVKWRIVGWGLGLQALFALLILKTPPGRAVFQWTSDAFRLLISFSDEGARFVWGWIYKHPEGDAAPVLAIDVLMTIVFFASLMAILYHLGIMQRVISGISRVMRKTMGTSGAETLAASANIFVGQTEAPLVVKPYVASMTRSELHALMVGGFATVAGGVLAAYVSFGFDPGHLVAASFMSAPAALALAKLTLPETEESPTAGEVKLRLERTTTNVLDAACAGAWEGLKLVFNVVAMLVAFVSLVAMVNWGIGAVHRIFDPDAADPLSMQAILGWILAPVAWLLGVPWEDCPEIGGLLGTRLVLNEFLAYLQLKDADVSPRAYIVATYAFCGFANLGSIAIQIGGISIIAPSRRKDLAKLGMRAMLVATVASFLTASIAGALLSDEECERDYRLNKARAAATREERNRQLDAFLERYPDSPDAPRFRDLKLR